jgi:NAD(P)-dependent dehydrogenase (short-subunit alcohol dehydrogenase family)
MASVLITGSSQGIGLAAALVLARAGHTVHATMRNPVRAPELGEIAAKESLPIHVSVMDVDSDSSVTDAISAIQAEHGPIDVLVNNAGIEIMGSVEELELSRIRAAMETNFFGTLRTMQAVLPSMRERRSGSIINVGSVSGLMSISPAGAYSATKWAGEALTEALAQETKGFNIRVAMIEPGAIATEMAVRLGRGTPPSLYPNINRMNRLTKGAFANASSPYLVADKVLEIIDSGTWVIRHRVGPDVDAFMDWRDSVTDEEWADWGALDDEAWYESVETRFGANLRPESGE